MGHHSNNSGNKKIDTGFIAGVIVLCILAGIIFCLVGLALGGFHFVDPIPKGK